MPASAAPVAGGSGFVAAFDASTFSAGVPTDADSARVQRTLANTNKYALTTWWSAKYATQTRPTSI